MNHLFPEKTSWKCMDDEEMGRENDKEVKKDKR